MNADERAKKFQRWLNESRTWRGDDALWLNRFCEVTGEYFALDAQLTAVEKERDEWKDAARGHESNYWQLYHDFTAASTANQKKIDAQAERAVAAEKENQRLRGRASLAEKRVRLEDAMMSDGIAALEALYGARRKDKRWIAAELQAAIERAVLALRAALSQNTSC